MTLTEMILAVSILSILSTALLGLLANSHADFELGRRRSDLVQETAQALILANRVLRQAAEIHSVSGPSDTAGSLSFSDANGMVYDLELDSGTDTLYYGPTGSTSELAHNITSLTFTCMDKNVNTLSHPVAVADIASVAMNATATDADDSSIHFNLSNQVWLPIDSRGIVINAIMYNPPGIINESLNEWIELYNTTDQDIDLAGWQIWTDTEAYSEDLIAHPTAGDGTTILGAGDYAIVTAPETQFFTELLTNGDFETGSISPWSNSGTWSITSDAADGSSWAITDSTQGSTWIQKTVTVPSSISSCLIRFWEYAFQEKKCTITLEIRDINNTLLETLYSAQMSDAWTHHTISSTAYIGQTIKLTFVTTNTSPHKSLYLDELSMGISHADPNALQLAVDDSTHQTIGNGLDNTSSTLTLTNGASVMDSVTYQDSWGGDGDGTSLARIDPNGPSSSADNWTAGPVYGTAGAAN